MREKETKFKLLLNRIDLECLLSKIAVTMMAVRSKGHVCLLVIWDNPLRKIGKDKKDKKKITTIRKL